MGCYTSPVFWQIQHLAAGLGKKNYAATTGELGQLMDLFGVEATVFCVSCLLSGIDLGQVNNEQSQRGQTAADLQSKVQFAAELVGHLWKADTHQQFGVCMRECLEGTVELASDKKNALGSINVEQLEIICRKVLKLSCEQQLCVGLGLMCSSHAKVGDEGARFIVATLFGSIDSIGTGLSDTVLSQVVWALRCHSVFLQDSELAKSCLLALQNAVPDGFAKIEVASFMVADSLCVDFVDGDAPAEASAAALTSELIADELGVEGVMQDLGEGCTATTETLRSILEPICADRKRKLGDEDVAGVLGMMAQTTSTSSAEQNKEDDSLVLDLQAEFSKLSTQGASAADKKGGKKAGKKAGSSSSGDGKKGGASGNGWDVGTFIHVAKDLSDNSINADRVIGLLGERCPTLGVETLDKAGFDLIVRAYKLMKGGKAMPGHLLLNLDSGSRGKLWANKGAQMALLNHAVNAPHDAVNFQKGMSGREYVSVPRGVETPPNNAWESLDLVATLDSLAASGFYQYVKSLFEGAVARYPEVLVLGLLLVNTPFDTLREETYALLLPKFLQSVQQRVNPLQPKQAVIKEIWKLNHYVLLRALVAMYARESEFLPFIVETVQQLDGGLTKLLDLPMPSLVFDAACFASRLDNNNDKFRLDDWLSAKVKTANAAGASMMLPFARNLLIYLQRKVSMRIQQASAQQQQQQGVQLQDDEVKIIFQKLVEIGEMQGVFAPEVRQEFLSAVDVTAERIQALSANPAAGAPAPGAPGAVAPPPGGVAGTAGTVNPEQKPADEFVDQRATSVLEMMYTAQKSTPEMVSLLKKLRMSESQVDQDTFNCMVYKLLDKYRYLHKYPDKMAELTGVLFGVLIQHDLISSMASGIALRYVLEALRKPVSTPVFRFGLVALDQFRGKLAEWPQTAAQVLKTPHIRSQHPELVRELEAKLGGVPGFSNEMDGLPPSSSTPPLPPQQQQQQSQRGFGLFGAGGGMLQQQQQQQQLQSQQLLVQSYPLRGTEKQNDQQAFHESLDELIGGPRDLPDVVKAPSEQIEERITFVINNLTQRHLDEKVSQAKQVLKKEHFEWVAYYLVANRVSTQGNYHNVYMHFLDELKEQDLVEKVRQRTIFTVRKLLRSNEIVSSTKERSVLKHLGSWLGRLTLAKNKPLLQREVDLKGLLLDGYERGWLIAVVPFAAKVLDGSKTSSVFSSNNPWILGILRTLAELYQLAELKLNLKFEIEVLCKNLSMDLKVISPSSVLVNCRKPRLEGNPDFNFKASSENRTAPSSPALTGHPGIGSLDGQQHQQQSQQQSQQPAGSVPGQASAAGGAAQQVQQRGDDKGAAIPEQTVIPNLAAYVHINPSLQLFVQQPTLRRVVPVAVDRAIREIIQPVVERSVSIASITSKEMIIKDFAMEPDENKMRKAAHLMVSNLAGALALVTCKEPLRVSIGNHLRSLLSQVTSRDGQQAVEQVVQVCASENLELGCMLIEKAATEKAMRDIVEQIEGPLNARRESREKNRTPFFDMSVFQTRSQYPEGLPPHLRPTPNPNGLAPHQLLVYEAFQRSQRQPIVPPSRSAVGAGGNAVGKAPGGGQLKMDLKTGSPKQQQQTSPVAATLTSLQALEKWRMLFGQLDRSVQEFVNQSPNARSTTLSRLPRDHGVWMILREIRSVALATVPAQRDEAISKIVTHVFKRLFDFGSSDTFILDIQFGLLDILRDAAKDPVALRKKITEWVIFLPEQHRLNRTVTIGLIKAKLISMPEFDANLAKMLDMGRQAAAVSYAMDVVRECIVNTRACMATEMLSTLDVFQEMVQRAKQTPQGGAAQAPEVPGLQQLLENVRAAASTDKVSQAQAAQQGQGGVQTAPQSQPGLFLRSPDQPAVRSQVAQLLHAWIQLCSRPEGVMHEAVHRPYLSLLQQQGAIKGNENAYRFFRITTELCVESALTQTVQDASAREAAAQRVPPRNALYYVAIDSFSKLVVLLVKYAEVRTTLLSMVLEVISNVLCREYLLRSQQHKVEAMMLDQRPYFRLFLNLQQDMVSLYDSEGVGEEVTLSMLSAFAEVYHRVLQPNMVPGFAFAWLELVSHRSFLPKLLRSTKDGKGWLILEMLLMDIFRFMHPFLKEAQLSPSIRLLYKGTLRVLLVLLHDFPEFLCSFHFSLCDVIPPSCIQLRNLVLSAFPRTMQLPDPFTRNLKVETLAESQKAPTIMSNYQRALAEGNLRADLEVFLGSGQPASFPNAVKDRLFRLYNQGAVREWNTELINALVLHSGIFAMLQLNNIRAQRSREGQSMVETLIETTAIPSVALVEHLVNDLEVEGRYLVVNAIANQLRFPSSHTHFFSSLLLFLFLQARHDVVREQITRVLLERLIVHRPHPWGLLITFIELIKNKRYCFWDYSFTKCAPEIHRLFESVARSCMPGGGAQVPPPVAST
ncbi:CCR4-NOT transcription complex subunit 1 (CCR4-associated factor 1) [Durusdinium trenchii]|uniref:CCR4-NOT transcription complex subunit 1 (CCR4-associated factor 1) n=1 Tax=Durusdinium trenchii TaxID=1381693 RepID=A0ABP0HT12_9DINO